MAPSEFWGMTPTEVFLLIEGRAPKSQQLIAEEELVEWRREMIEQGHDLL